MTPEDIRALDGPGLAQWAFDHELAPPSIEWRQGHAPHLWVRDTRQEWRPWECVAQANAVFLQLRARGWSLYTRWYFSIKQGYVLAEEFLTGHELCCGFGGPGEDTEALALLRVSVLAVASQQEATHGR